MQPAVAIAGLCALASAAPKDTGWHWSKSQHPGWLEPSVYTPREQFPPQPSWSPQTLPRITSLNSFSESAIAPPHSSVMSRPTSTASNDEMHQPCATVSRLVASQSSVNILATPTVPALLAHECINSVPFNQSAAVALMDSIRPFLDWQSTTEYIADPPADYVAHVQAPYDFWEDWNSLYQRVMDGDYANEYAFGFDLYMSFLKAHDGHFVYFPDSVTLIFSYARDTPLVSISTDGWSIPEVYAYTDVLAASFGNTTYTPSPLSMIDGRDSTEWLLDFSKYGSLQDPDARWNNLFFELAQVSLGAIGTGVGMFAGGGRGRWIFPGACTNLTFANGTTITIENFARVMMPFDGITTGEDLYRTYFMPPSNETVSIESIATVTSELASSMTASTTISPFSSETIPASTTYIDFDSTTIPAPGYPSPVVRQKSNLNSGYFLEGEGYEDIVVLSLPSFVGTTYNELSFQAANANVITEAVSQGKTKLIIDVSANGGGTILQGYDLFKQLFPQILPFGASRFRAHEALDLISQEVSYYSGLVPRSITANESVVSWVSSAWNYRTDTDVNYEAFDSWDEKFRPHSFGPGQDNFTSLFRWNLSDVLTPWNSGGIYVSGYLNRSNVTTQPFAAENIVIVYDGYCASTCAVFSELMRQQAGIKTIALGGRPNRNIVQAVGGVKGTNDFPFDYILDGVKFPFQKEYLHNKSYYRNTILGKYNALAILRSTNAVINARDGIRQGDKTQTPLQFRYETADCRIFYTPEMTVDVTAIWKTVADTAFNGISHCAAGNYTIGTGITKRHGPRRKHLVRRDLVSEQHYESLRGVWTGMQGVRAGGDGFMPV